MKNIKTYFKNIIDSLNAKEYFKLKQLLRNEDEINNILLSLKKNNVIIPIGNNHIEINNTKELIACINAIYFYELKG